MTEAVPKTIQVTFAIDEALWEKLLELRVSPAAFAKAALRAEVRRHEVAASRKERKKQLEAVRRIDPRVTEAELMSSSSRVRRLRRMASVHEPSVGI
jgi:hypothetical protein